MVKKSPLTPMPDNPNIGVSTATDQYKNEVITVLSSAMALNQQMQVKDSVLYQDHSIGYFPAYRLLRRAGTHSIPQMIKSKRQQQFPKFAQPVIVSPDANKTGLNLEYKDGRIPSKQEKEVLENWERRLVYDYFIPPFESKPNLLKWLNAAYNDFFDLDSIAIELIRGAYGRIIGITLNDPTLIYPVIQPSTERGQMIFSKAVSDLLPGNDRFNPAVNNENNPDYLYIIDDILRMKYKKDVLQTHHLNKTTDISRVNRGFSYVERSLIMLGYLSGMLQYNASNFNETKIPNGLLVLKGAINSGNLLESIKRNIHAHQTDSRFKNRFATIALPETGDANWVKLKETSKDEEFHQFFVLSGTIFCYCSGVAPEEVGLPSYKQILKKATLNDTGDDGLMQQSSDEGTRLFFTHIENCLNERDLAELITGIPVKIRFLGFETQDMKKREELNKIRLETGSASINDIRNEQGLSKAKNPMDIPGISNIYDIPGLNNQFVQQIINSQLQQQQQQAMQEQQQMQQQPGQMPDQPAPQQGQEGQIPDDYTLSEDDYAKLEKRGISREQADQMLQKAKETQANAGSPQSA